MAVCIAYQWYTNALVPNTVLFTISVFSILNNKNLVYSELPFELHRDGSILPHAHHPSGLCTVVQLYTSMCTSMCVSHVDAILHCSPQFVDSQNCSYPPNDTVSVSRLLTHSPEQTRLRSVALH